MKKRITLQRQCKLCLKSLGKKKRCVVPTVPHFRVPLGKVPLCISTRAWELVAAIDLTQLTSVKPELLFLSHVSICWHLSRVLVTINVYLLLLKSIFQGLRTKEEDCRLWDSMRWLHPDFACCQLLQHGHAVVQKLSLLPSAAAACKGACQHSLIVGGPSAEISATSACASLSALPLRRVAPGLMRGQRTERVEG